MKKLALLFFLLSSLPMISQVKKFTVDSVITVDTTSAELLFTRGKSAIMNILSNVKSDDVIIDETSKRIIISDRIVFDPDYFIGSERVHGWIAYNLNLYFRDGRFRIIISDFVHIASSRNGISFGVLTDQQECPTDFGWQWGGKFKRKNWNQMKRDANSHSNYIISQMIKKLNQESIMEDTEW